MRSHRSHRRSCERSPSLDIRSLDFGQNKAEELKAISRLIPQEDPELTLLKQIHAVIINKQPSAIVDSDQTRYSKRISKPLPPLSQIKSQNSCSVHLLKMKHQSLHKGIKVD